MNRINHLFQTKKDHILSIYFTAGYPQLNDTVTIIQELEKAGADLIEIGIPFSDPLADGPTIQGSAEKALENGMTMKLLFEQLKDIRETVKMPLILMGYLNPIWQFGIERFCQQCQAVGIDGLIIPDLPMQEYIDFYKTTFEAHGLHNIFLMTPQTSPDRIHLIDEQGSGFIYMVAAASITGAKRDISKTQIDYFERTNALNLKLPRLIGFGISNHETYSKACQFANGVIIGSAFIRALAKEGELGDKIGEFVQMVRGEELVNK